MMAFFFTIPISRMIPISAMMVSSVEKHQRDQRADAGRRQRRDDGQRMNQALVQDAQNDVDRQQRGPNQDGLVRQRILKCLRGAGETCR